MRYKLNWLPETKDDLLELSKGERAIIFKQAPPQLVHQPQVQTNNRAPLKQELSPTMEFWRLRLGDLRVYYVVEDDTIYILAVGKKECNHVRVGKQMFDMPELIQFLKDVWPSP